MRRKFKTFTKNLPKTVNVSLEENCCSNQTLINLLKTWKIKPDNCDTV